jgi:hypothetical protein
MGMGIVPHPDPVSRIRFAGETHGPREGFPTKCWIRPFPLRNRLPDPDTKATGHQHSHPKPTMNKLIITSLACATLALATGCSHTTVNPSPTTTTVVPADQTPPPASTTTTTTPQTTTTTTTPSN